MEYVYAAMLLHKAEKEINEDNVKKVLKAAGVDVDEARVKALVAALEDVNIEEAIEKSQAPVAAAAAPAEGGEGKKEESKEGKGKKEESKEEKKEKEEEGKSEEEAAEGLGSLFG